MERASFIADTDDPAEELVEHSARSRSLDSGRASQLKALELGALGRESFKHAWRQVGEVLVRGDVQDEHLQLALRYLEAHEVDQLVDDDGGARDTGHLHVADHVLVSKLLLDLLLQVLRLPVARLPLHDGLTVDSDSGEQRLGQVFVSEV